MERKTRADYEWLHTVDGKTNSSAQWVFEPWAGGGAGRWYHGPLHDVCKEQMAVLEQFEELDIPHSGIYAEGAGAHWFKNPKSEELYKIVAFAEKKRNSCIFLAVSRYVNGRS